MNATDTTYLGVASDITTNGHHKEDRTGTGTMSVFGKQMKFSLMAGTLPLLTTKELKLRSIIHELIWFLRGEGNIAYLKENKVGIWDAWSDENGDLGPVYGVQWRHWNDTRVIPADDWPRYEARGFKESFRDPITGMMAIEREIDQIAELIHQLMGVPRDVAFLALAPGGIGEMALLAVALDLDPIFVAFHHLLRLIVLMLLLPVMARHFRHRRAREATQ